MNWQKLILLMICCALAFGGTFTCKSESGSSSITKNSQE